MPTLLRVDSSPLTGDASFSRRLTHEFVEEWRAANPGGKVISRDLSATRLAPVDAEWIGAVYTPEARLTAAQRAAVATSNELVAELEQAGEYVFGVPMHNFSVPGSLKLWIDQVARAGRTFTFKDGGAAGLLRNKRATFLVATGGVYDAGSPAAAMNFVEPYLRAFFGFLGVTDTTFINAGGTSRRQRGVDPGAILEPAVAAIRRQFQPA